MNLPKKQLKIVYMGTPDFAVAGLDLLRRSGYPIVGVITAPDKPAGRGRAIQQSAIKKYAMANGIKILQPTNLKSKEFHEQLASLNANLQIVVAFRMLPKAVWEMPELGTFNLHASILPQYRGAAPINWAIINGEQKTGVTTFFIDEQIDTGAIIMQRECPIMPDESAGNLHDKLMKLGAELILETVEQIAENKVTTKSQSKLGVLKEAPKLTRENCKIDWSKAGMEVFNLIRGLNPYPGAWCWLNNGNQNKQLKIFEASFIDEKHGYAIGQLRVEHKNLTIYLSDGKLLIHELQLEGKRKMKAIDVINGGTIDLDTMVL